ncbi:hypothetical protein GCM10011349_13050 [Novosphingobium indicum]|uniref:CopG family transcriptional regulator n=1 Tax=Novosphingobium indicum TaxID=462949 RepID=A0ABQ2JG64_9SPHN|nr:hypothetical protein GCM10011349_13050 [Novosphingobium indicum]
MKRATLQRQRALHIGLSERERGIEREAQRQLRVAQAHGHLGAGTMAEEFMRSSTMIDDGQLPRSDHGVKQPRK